MTSATQAPETQRVNCPACGKPVILRFKPGRIQARAHWRCPYGDCGGIHASEIRGYDLVASADVFSPTEPKPSKGSSR